MQSVSLTLAALVTLATVGAVQVFNQFKVRDWEGLITIAVAAVVGLVAGLAHFMGLDVTTAVTVALGAVGLHTVTK